MKKLFVAIFMLLLASCAHVISDEVLKEAEPTRDIPFEEVRSNIEKYIGKTFIWGGFIADIHNTDEGTYIEVVQNPINRYGYIADIDISGGRFLALTKRHLDPLIFKRNREVTVAGTLIEGKRKRLGDVEYLYPVLKVRELHLWKEGYYTYPPYYHPYYYYPQYYPYDPFWPYDPYYWPPYPGRPFLRLR